MTRRRPAGRARRPSAPTHVSSPAWPDGPVIFACLHRDILPAILHVRERKPILLVSTSPDGEILLRTLGEKDYGFVRGQTGREGARALVELRRRLQEGRSIGLAVDGPKGPYGSIRLGVLQLARLAGVPILPLRAEAASAWVLDTWDRTVVPRPFSRVQMVCAPPVWIDAATADEDLERIRGDLGRFFEAEGDADADR